jgi:hypothetical protein
MIRTANFALFFLVVALAVGCSETPRGSNPTTSVKNDDVPTGRTGSDGAAGPKEKKQAESDAKINKKGGEKGTYVMIGDRTVKGERYRMVHAFARGSYQDGESSSHPWPVVAAEYAKLKVGMKLQEEIRPILGIDEFWYMPNSPTDRFVVTLDDMKGKTMTLTFSGDWPNTRLVDKSATGLK